MITIQRYTQFLKNYARKYISMVESKEDKSLIEFKLAHTYRVRDNMIKIAKSCNLTEYDQKIAELIGLFHDIGRFEQYVKYRTYDDKKSVNHAVFSAKIIKENKILEEEMSEEDQRVIYQSIFYHNVYRIDEIEEELSERAIYFLKMIRDADRLDIYKSMAEVVPNLSSKERYIWYNERADENEISDLIYHQILEKDSPSMKDCKTIVESQFARISWVFKDISFKESIGIILKKKYFEKIHEDMKHSERSEKMYEYVMKYLVDMLEQDKTLL